MKRFSPYLSVIIPIFNEEKRLKNISKIIKYLSRKKFSSEIIIIDDGSRDSSLRVLRSLNNIRFLSNKPNRGKEFAIK